MKFKNDLKTSIQPIFFLCQLFGLHFTGLNFDRSSSNFLKFFLRIWSLILYLLILILFTSENYNVSVKNQYVILQINDLVIVFSDLILCLFDVIGNYKNRLKIHRIVSELLELQRALKLQLKINPSFVPLKKFLLWQFFIGLILWFIFVYYYVFVLCPQKSKCLPNLFMYYVSTLVCHIHNIQFCSLIIAIVALFQTINTKLLNLANVRTYPERAEENLHIISPDYKINEDLKSLNIIRQVYDKLYEITKKLNRAYSVRLLLAFVNGIFVIFGGLYSAIFGMNYDGNITDKWNSQTMILNLSFLGICCIKICILAYSCEKLVNESKNTAVVIHKISINSTDRAIKEAVSNKYQLGLH